MLSHKTVLDNGQRKGAFSRIRGFSQGRIEESPGRDPPIDYLAVGESTAGSGRCVCRARGVEGAGDRAEGGFGVGVGWGGLWRMLRSCRQECLQIVTSI